MKKLLSINHNSESTHLAILIARVSIGFLMLTHGLPKLLMLFSGQPVQFPGLFGLTPEFALALTVFAEVFCSILIIGGIATRLAAIPLIITMLVAVFYVHLNDPLVKKEIGLLYLAGYIVLLFTGSGKYSFDYLLQERLKIKKVYELNNHTK